MDNAENTATSAEQAQPGVDAPASNGGAAAAPDPAGASEGAGGPSFPIGLSRAFAALQAEAKGNYERLLRTAADFENFKRRARRDQTSAGVQAEDKVVLSFLPIMDNLERALDHAAATSGSTDETAKGLIDGVRMVHKQFISTLERFGITLIESVGQPFDPEFHEAIQQTASELPRNHVVAQLQRGYRRAERLVRPAMVIVSTGPAEAATPAPPAEPAADETPRKNSNSAAAPESAEPESQGNPVISVSGVIDTDGIVDGDDGGADARSKSEAER